MTQKINVQGIVKKNMNTMFMKQDSPIFDDGTQHTAVQVVAPGAHMQYTFAPIEGGAYEHTFELEQNSTLAYSCVLHNEHSLSLRLKIILKEKNACAHIAGIYLASGNQHVTIHTEQIHCAAATESTLCINGAVSGSAQVSYEGMIYIAEDAAQTNAALENKNIVLSEQARVKSVPSLEVLTNDVHCTHGSAIGYLDEEQLWYMQSRGLSVQQAKKILLEGFLTATKVVCNDELSKNIRLRVATMVE